MKKNTVGYSLLICCLVLVMAAPVQAQETTSTKAGVVPGSSWYFFDTFAESVKDFFTFNSEKKATQQVEFAKERMEEKKALLEESGDVTEELETVDKNLQKNLEKTSDILTTSAQKGKNTTELSKLLSNEIEKSDTVLKNDINSEIEGLNTHEQEIEQQIREAKAKDDVEESETLTKKLTETKIHSTFLEKQKEHTTESVAGQKAKIDEHMTDGDEAAQKIAKTKEARNYLAGLFKKKNLIPPAGSFEKIDNLLVKAQTAFEAGKYEDARYLAKTAEKSYGDLEKILRELVKTGSKEASLKKNLTEAERKYAENAKVGKKVTSSKVSTETKKEQEIIKEDLKKVTEEKKEAEKKLTEVNAEIKKVAEEEKSGKSQESEHKDED